MKKPNKKQIEQEIKELTEIKPKVRHFSMFEDDNHKCIEVQIEVLTDNLSYEQIEDFVVKEFLCQFEDET